MESNDARKDISLMIGDFRFNFRVAGYITCCDKVLLHIGTGAANHWNMPGGRLKIGEQTLDGIKRELYEELGYEFDNYTLINVSENFFNYAGVDSHELLFVYEIKIDKNHELYKKQDFESLDHDGMLYKWFNKEEAQKLHILPVIIYDFLKMQDIKLYHHVEGK